MIKDLRTMIKIDFVVPQCEKMIFGSLIELQP